MGRKKSFVVRPKEKYDISKDWLYQKYFVEKLSLKEVGKLIGASAGPIRHRMKKYGFRTPEDRKMPENARDKQKLKINKEDLFQKYIVELQNTTQIAQLYNCSAMSISKYLKEYEIPARTNSEAKMGYLNPAFNKPSKQKGLERTTEQIENIKAAVPRGSAHFRYKNPEDRIEPINNQIRNCQKSKDWKFSVLKRDNFCCVLCPSTKNLEVDHIIPFATIKQKFNITSLESAMLCDNFFDIDNGRTLCHECHIKTDSYGWKGETNKREDSNG